MSDDGAAIQCVEALLTLKKTSDLTRAKHFWWVIFFPLGATLTRI